MVILLMAGALAVQALSQSPPPLIDMPRKVFEITGANPRECGRHPLRQVNGRREGATRKQLEASLQCAREAIKAGQAFWTFVELPGIDSWVGHGFLRTASGDVRFFEYDSDPCGGIRCGPDLSLYPCAEPVVTADAGGEDADFSCRDR
jgi:hypothetical protein